MRKIMLCLAIAMTILLMNGCTNADKTMESSSAETALPENVEASFGDGRFVILKSTDSTTGWTILTLFDNEFDYEVERDVNVYVEKFPYVYALGSRGNTRMDYTNGEMIQNEKLDKFTDSDREVFQQLYKDKSTVSK